MLPVAEDQEVVSFPPRAQTPYAYDADALTWDLPSDAVSPNIVPSPQIPLPAFISPLEIDRRRTPVFTPPVFASTPPHIDYFSLPMGPVTDELSADGPRSDAPSPSDVSTADSQVDTPEYPYGLALLTMSSRTARQRQRDFAHSQLVNNPLDRTTMGRSILQLHEYTWYTLANGLTAMRFGRGESIWRANDVGNHINWLRCGAYCHRSQVHNLIAVVNIECLNERIRAAGGHPINPMPYQPNWDYGLHNEPTFTRRLFVSRHQLPSAQP
jgi:hypothetical protein